MAICLAVIYDIQDGHEEEAAGYLLELTALSRREPGCLSYHSYRAHEDPRRFFIYEIYEDRAALEEHMKSPHFERYGINGIRRIARRREAVIGSPLGE
jgi:quinol monooxygenase YgiN